MNASNLPPIEHFWSQENFTPNANQKKAILHTNGPLLLAAGPGSGKTRVLLWRTLNLIVYHNIRPDEIFFSTFTDKAARQLREGLISLLALVSNETGVPYDIANMYVGTVHSLCRNLLADRRFSRNRERRHLPTLLNELQQFLLVYRRSNWLRILESGGLEEIDAVSRINQFFKSALGGDSRHRAVENLTSLFNRFSEENLAPDMMLEQFRQVKLSDTENRFKKKLIQMYGEYLKILTESGPFGSVDFALLQQRAYERIGEDKCGAAVIFFKRVKRADQQALFRPE